MAALLVGRESFKLLAELRSKERQMHRDRAKIITAALLLSLGLAAESSRAENRTRFTLNDILSVEPIGETALSPDGTKIAIVRGGQIQVMPAAGGWPVPLTAAPGGKNGLSWAPDGSKIA